MLNPDPNPQNPDQIRVQLETPAQQPELSTGSSSRQTTSLLGGLSATVGEEEDGFRTPTDSDKRIPEMQKCPPAPQKPTADVKMRLTKRKNSPVSEATWMNRSRRISILFDFCDEIESMYPPLLRANLKCKIKKARTV